MTTAKRFSMSLLLFVFLLLGCQGLLSADADTGDEDLQSLELRMEEEARRLRFFHTNTGFGFSLLNMDFSSLNQLLEPAGFTGLDSNLFVTNWTVTLGAQEGFRLGWSSVKGDQIKDQGDLAYTLSLRGLLLEYGTSPDDRFDFSLGTVLGRGTHTLNLVHGDGKDWGEVIDNPQTTGIEQDFWFLEPQLNCRVGLTSLLKLHLLGGYSFSFGENIWLMNDREIQGDHLSVNGWRIGITVGFGF